MATPYFYLHSSGSIFPKPADRSSSQIELRDMSDIFSSPIVDSFERDGYVYLPGFLNTTEVAELHTELARFLDEVVPTMPREEVFFEDKKKQSTLKQLQRMFQYDRFFHNMMFGSKFEDLAKTLLGHPVRGINLQYFNKPPMVGQATPPHQDGYYFQLEPQEAVTMWLALERADEQNGCVRYLRGSHLRGMRPHARTETLGFSQGITDFGGEVDREHAVVFPAEPGDLLVHHAMTVHWADANRSTDRNRRAMGFIYYSQLAKELSSKEERDAKLAKELKLAGKL
jgi:phytanoyl-CoA hydroxylase